MVEEVCDVRQVAGKFPHLSDDLILMLRKALPWTVGEQHLTTVVGHRKATFLRMSSDECKLQFATSDIDSFCFLHILYYYIIIKHKNYKILNL